MDASTWKHRDIAFKLFDADTNSVGHGLFLVDTSTRWASTHQARSTLSMKSTHRFVPILAEGPYEDASKKARSPENIDKDSSFMFRDHAIRIKNAFLPKPRKDL